MTIAKKWAFLAAAVLAAILVSCRKPEPAPPSSRDIATPAFPRAAAVPRKDAFFGLHFDLHPQATDTSLGADISEENIRALLERVRPDFVQYDGKGHAGWTGYPTAVGWASPGIVNDSLAVWRKATRDLGVSLYIHYSGVWDSKAVAEHPDWARMDANGKRDPNATSVFGPYVDELLIPQLKEVTAKYGLDGVWADGECWGAQLDYSSRALAAWTAETGDKDAPKDRTDPRWLEWKMFHRRAFERYLAHWIDALHALLNLHYSVDILAEHQLIPRLKEFPLVVVPDSHKLTDEFRQALADHVAGGGSLLLLGEKCARLFEPLLGVTLEGGPSRRTAELASAMGVTNADGVWQKVALTSARPAGFIYPTRDTRKGGEIAATVNDFGKGKVAAVFGPVASIFFRSHHPWLRKFIGGLAAELFPEPAVKVGGPPGLDVSLRTTRDGRLSVHLLNTTGTPLPDRYGFTDFIPPLERISLRINVPRRPKSVVWVPDGGRLDWTWSDGLLKVTLPRLEIHGVLVVEPGRPPA